MKISIIVPVYNVQDYLVECIESVLNQTSQDFELVLVDDGSTDDSGSICDLYASRLPQQVKAVHATNRGAFQARLRGIQEVDGDVLMFLDSDDCLRKDALEYINACFIKNDCDMVLFDASESDKFPSSIIINKLNSEDRFEGNTKKHLYKMILEGRIPNSVCLKAVRRSCVDIPEEFHNCYAKYGEDLLLSVHLMTYCSKIVYLNEGLYHYRIRPGSAVNSIKVQAINDSVKTVHTEIENYIDEWNLPELKPLHNARKVKGWVRNFSFLQAEKKSIAKSVYKEVSGSMAKDSYFRSAYKHMDAIYLSYYERIMAWSLFKKQYWILNIIYRLKKIIKSRNNFYNK